MAKKTKEKFNIYQMITDKIIAQMEQGIIPWRKPWTGVIDGAISYVSGKPYSFLNQMLLCKPGEWISRTEIEKRGGKIKKGAKSGIVCFYTQTIVRKQKDATEDGADVVVTTFQDCFYPVLKFYHVFHLDDVEGIKSKIDPAKPAPVLEPVEKAEQVINGYLAAEPHLKFINDRPSNRAYFSPSSDEVVVPMMSQFSQVEEYYSTAFHELTHSTLTEDRCNRKEENKGAHFGNEQYSREELVAELGAAMLVNVCGMDAKKAFNNSVAYLQSWMRALKDDSKAIVWAAGRAEKAARYIQGEREVKQVTVKEAA